jgi:hypothetical protein
MQGVPVVRPVAHREIAADGEDEVAAAHREKRRDAWTPLMRAGTSARSAASAASSITRFTSPSTRELSLCQEAVTAVKRSALGSS